MAELRDEAIVHGINTESFHSPFAPDRLEYLHLPKIKTVFASTGGHFRYRGRVDETIDINILSEINAGTDHNDEPFDRLLEATVDSMYASRALHLRIEEIYACTIDFEKINGMTEEIMRELVYSNANKPEHHLL